MNWIHGPPARLMAHLQQREEQVFLLLSLLIGALTGLAVVGFIVVTERLGMRLYPVGSAAWRRVLVPVAGSLAMAFCSTGFFLTPEQRRTPDQGRPLRSGWVHLPAHRPGQVFCTADQRWRAGFHWREGPSVQVGAGIDRSLADGSDCARKRSRL